jgi:hypothetical protein
MSAQIPTFMAFKNGEKIESMTSADQDKLQVRAPPLLCSALLPLTMLYRRK